jgi:Ca2+/Na+ antiporter
LFKQILGGLNFVFLSFLLVLGKISVINGLQGFRYIFLLCFSLFLSKKRRHMIAEDDDSRTFTQKSFGIILIFIGTVLLFV